MKGIGKRWKQILSLLLIAAMLAGNLPVNSISAYAMEAESSQEMSTQDVELISDEQLQGEDIGQEAVEEAQEEEESSEEILRENSQEELSSQVTEENVQKEDIPEEGTQEDIQKEISTPESSEEALVQEQESIVNEEERKVQEDGLQEEQLKKTELPQEQLLSEAYPNFYIHDDPALFSVQIESPEVTEQELITELAKYSGQYPSVIIDLPTEKVEFSKELWNAVVAKVAEGGRISVDSFVGAVGIHWMIKKPAQVQQKVALSVRYQMKNAGEGMEISLENSSLPAGELSLEMETADAGVVNNAVTAFGSGGIIKIFHQDGTSISNKASKFQIKELSGQEGNYITFDLQGLENSNPQTTYSVKRVSYGISEIEESLAIIQVEDAEKPLTKEELLQAINSVGGRKYNSITISMEKLGGEMAYAEITNRLVTMLNPAQSNQTRIISYEIKDRKNELNYQWTITNPTGKETADQSLSANIFMNDQKQLSLQASPVSMGGKGCVLRFYVKLNCEFAELLSLMAQETGKELTFKDSSMTCQYSFAPTFAHVLEFSDAALLESGKVYVVQGEEYTGIVFDTEDGGKGLGIYEKDASAFGNSFNDEAIYSILENYGNNKEKFNAIEICYNSKNPTSISKNVWNKAVELLEGNERTLFFAGEDGQKDGQQWLFVNPQRVERDVTIKATVTKKEAGMGIALQLENTSFAAQITDFMVMSHSQLTGYNSFMSALGTHPMAELVNHQDKVMEEIEVLLQKRERQEGDYCRVRVFSVEKLEAGKSYTVKSKPYTGEIYRDEENNRTNLELNPGVIGKEHFTVDELQTILSLQGQTKFDEIYVEYPISQHVLQKEVIELLAGYLNQDRSNGDKFVKVGFYEIDDKGYRYPKEEWRIANPKVNAMSQDQQVNLTVSTENTTVKAELVKPEINADYVQAWYCREKGSKEAEQLRACLGEQNAELRFVGKEGSGVGEGYYQVEHDTYRDVVEIYDINTLETGSYSIELKYGQINEEDWGNGARSRLFISSMDVGKDSFASGDLQKYLSYYVNSGMKFDSIHIEQKDISGKNFIKKEDINFLRTLFTEGNGDNRWEITYTFCSCKEDETQGRTTQDTNWILANPGVATADINANLTVTEAVGQGLKLKFNKFSYQGEDLAVQLRANETTALAGTMKTVLGEAGEMTEGEPGIIVLEKSVTPKPQFGRNYWMEKEGDDEKAPKITCLYLAQVSDYTAGTEYLVAPLNIRGAEKEECFYVGDDEHNKKLLEKEAKTMAEKVTWQSFNPETLLINAGNPEALNQGEVYYTGTYTVGKTTYCKVFKNWVEVKLQSFKPEKNELTLSMYRDREEIKGQEAYLRIYFYPTAAQMDQADLIWEIIEGEEYIELQKSLRVNNETDPPQTVEKEDGGIKAIAPGTAKIKISLPDGISCEGESSVICTVKVLPIDEIPQEEWPEDIFAITNFDTTLKTVELPGKEEGRGYFRWADPATSLTPYKDLRNHNFPAIYTTKDGREIETSISVNFISLKGIEVGLIQQNAEGIRQGDRGMLVGEEITLGYFYQLYNGDEHYLERYKDRLQVEWSTKPAKLGTVENAEDKTVWKYTPKAGETGVKEVTVTLKDKATNKVIGKDSMKVTVMKKNAVGLWNFFNENGTPNDENIIWNQTEPPVNGVIGEKGILSLRLPKEEYYQLTLKSLDTAVWKLGKVTVEEVMEEIQGEEGKENRTYVVTSVPYEITGYGMCRLSVTAADEIKSQAILQLREIADPRPDYHGGVVKINKNLSEKAADIPIVLGKETIVKRGEIKLTGTGANNFEFVTLNGSDQEELEGIVHGYVSLSNKSAEKGNYKLALEFPIYRKVNGQQLEKILDAKLNITISITDVMPKLTVKQNKKVNTFYTNESGDGFGMLTINSTEKITSVNLIAQKNGTCDYELMSVDDSGATQWIKPKNETNFSGKKAVVQIYLEGYEKPVEKNITVAVEEKAPKLEFESKKFTFYPNFNLTGEEFMIINKTTQSSVFIQEMQWQESKTAQREITPEGISVNLKKNQYELKRTDRGVFVELKTKLAASDKLEVSVKEAGWRKAVKVSTTLAIVIKEPKLALEKKKLELNTHPSVFDRQTAYTKVKLENSAINLHNAEILFTGQDAKSREALNNSIQLEFWHDTSEIVTRFNVTEAKDLPKDGTYKYRLTIKFHDLDKQLSADFTVNLKAKAPEKCVTISKQGKLDVLDRTGSVLVYKPKVNGLSGVVTYGELAGKDKDMFRTEWDGLSGCLYIYTNPWITYSTKLNYEVIPVFEVLDHRIGSCRVYTKAEKIKVTQGKASVLIESQGNVLYEERNNELILTFNALLDKKYPMKVSKITLLNYTNDLGILGQDFWDEGEVMPRIQLGRIGVKQILQKGKKWNLKFEVELKDQAGNSQNVQVTYPVIIR